MTASELRRVEVFDPAAEEFVFVGFATVRQPVDLSVMFDVEELLEQQARTLRRSGRKQRAAELRQMIRGMQRIREQVR